MSSGADLGHPGPVKRGAAGDHRPRPGLERGAATMGRWPRTSPLSSSRRSQVEHQHPLIERERQTPA
jgi:hypothetical protein